MSSTFQVLLTLNKREFSVTLEDTKTSRKLQNMLPLEFDMFDLDGAQKYVFLQDAMPTNPESLKKIEVGDVLLYEDRCLSLFYRPCCSNYRYTILGKVDEPAPLEATLSGRSSVVATLRRR